MRKAVILMLIVFSLIAPLITSSLATADSKINRSNRTLVGSVYGVEGGIEEYESVYGVEGGVEETPEPVETPEPTNTPETTSPPVLEMETPLGRLFKSVCGPTAIILFALLPLVGVGLLRRKSQF
jgi:hypothetical protein